MNDQRWELQMASSINSQYQLGRLLSHLFSDQQLFLNHTLRKHISQDRKGYVHLNVLQSLPLIQQYFSMIQLEVREYQIRLIQGAVEDFCPELMHNWGRIRRLNAFDVKRFKTEKPISLERIRERQTISDLRDIMGSDCYIMNSRIQPRMEEKVLIYTNHYREEVSRHEALPFRIIDYSELCKEMERKSRYKESREKSYYRPLDYSMGNQKIMSQNNRKFHELTDDEQLQLEKQNKAKFDQICKLPNPNFNLLLLTN